jgi:hypothetical protein
MSILLRSKFVGLFPAVITGNLERRARIRQFQFGPVEQSFKHHRAVSWFVGRFIDRDVPIAGLG